ncbi:hypothetical protein DL96DRAFT_1573192 [Flagelloscypha sp. PMI_526]|nr:hypothetical protein DL96DRAFT_1573192 [Flagelloscypha sp. PMI_526]
MDSTVLLPGQPVPSRKGPAPQLGSGLYIRDGHIRASLVGTPQQIGSTLSIPRVRPSAPAPNSVVLGTITRLSPTQATLYISCIIRSQDVRAQAVKISDCFRGGDVVKGLVISLGDARNYFVTTARNDLGVIFATSEAGATMEPVSWIEMRCPKTGAMEKRKVAKPESL